MSRASLFLVFFMFIWSSYTNASPASLSFQGRILGTNGKPLEHNNVSFEFSITSADGSCVIYQEIKSGIDMRNSSGMFDTPIGLGTKIFPSTPSPSINDIFSNGATYNCLGGSTYTPAYQDVRRLRVQFYDGVGWRLISPDNVIRSVPYSMVSAVAERLGNNLPSDFVLTSSVPSCGASEYLTFAAGVWSCEPFVAGAGSVSSLTGDVTSTGTGAVVTLISNSAVTTSKIADGNVTGVKLENSGVTAGTYPKVTVDAKGRVTSGSALSASDIPNLDAAKINSGVLDPARLGTGTADNTKYLRGDGTWQVVPSSGGTVTSITAGTGLTGGTITGSGTIGLDTELAGVNALATTGFVRRTGAGTYATSTSIDLASQITGTLPIANGGTGATTAIGALTNILPAQTGNAGKVLQTDGTNVTWETPAASGITALTGDVTASGSGSVAATIASGAVTTAKIADGNVTGVKLENSGVTAGTYGSASSIPSFTVDAKGRITSVSANSVSGLLPAASGNSGKFLKSDGTNWAGADVLFSEVKNAVGLAAFSGSACAANQALGWSSVTDSFVCQAIGSLNASAITAGTIATARLGSGTADNTTYLRGDGTWAAVSTADATKLPLAGGTMAGTINMNGNQITNVSNVPFVATNPAAGQDGQTLRWNNTAGQWEWFTAGAAGAGIASVNGLSGSAQTLAPSATATSYGFSSAGSTHTLSIPSASTAGVTAGTISKTEYDAFNAKQAAGNYITTMTGDVTSSGFSAGSVTTTIANNAVTTAKINDNAITTVKIADGNVTGVKLENSGVTAGTYPKVTVDAKGRVTVGASLSASDIPNLDAAKITSGVLDVARLGTGTADNTTYLRGDGTWATVASSGGTVTSITAGTGLTGGTITGSGTIGLGTELTGVNALSTTGFVRRTGAGTYATSSSIDLASQITGTLPIANGGTGATNAAAALTNLLPNQTGNNGKVLQTDGANATWVTPAASGITALTGEVTASGSGSVAATIANNAVTSAKINDGSIVGADMDFTGVNAATTNFVMKDSTGKFYNLACSTTGHVPTWTAAGFACQAPSVNETDPKVGANTTNYLSKWDGAALVASGVYESSGSVGIGTAAPSQKLHVRSANATDEIRIENTSSTAARNPRVAIVNYQGGVAGAGGFPEARFVNLRGSSASAAPTSSGDLLGIMSFYGMGDSAWVQGAKISVGTEELFSDTTAASYMTFATTNSGAALASEKMRITANGNVGIGAPSPGAKLEVAGQVKITGGSPGAGKVLTSDASGLASWQTVSAGGVGTVTSIAAGTGLTGGTITGSGTIGLDTELTGLNSLSTTGFVKRTAAGTYSTPAISLTADITGTLPIANGGTGATTATAALTNLLPSQSGHNGKVLQTDGTAATWVTPAASGITALTGDVTASGSGSVAATIANNAVTSAKISNGSIVGADMDFTGVNTATTNLVMKDSTGKFFDFACSTTGHVPTWTVAGFACQAPTASTSPAGSNGQLQYNNSSSFGGTSALVYSGTTLTSTQAGTTTPALTAEFSDVGPDNFRTHVRAGSVNVRNSGGGSDTFTTGLELSHLGLILRNASTGETASDGTLLSVSGQNATINNREPGSLTLSTNNSARVTVLSGGDVGVGTATPSQKLHVAGNIKATGQLATGSQTITSGTNNIDWNGGNSIITDYDCGATINFSNMLDGGTYTLIVTGTGTAQCNFSTTIAGTDAGTVAYKWNPANGTRTASTYTLYTFMRVGGIVLVAWSSGFN